MNEIQAGLAKPLDAGQMQQLLQTWMPKIHSAIHDSEVLRNRIANGERSIASAQAGTIRGLDADAIVRAQALLEQLRLELREAEFWATAGIGIALAYGVAEIIGEAAEDEGWNPPSGSVVRIVMPGVVNLAVELRKKEKA